MPVNATLWKQQLRRVAERLEKIDEFDLSMFRNTGEPQGKRLSESLFEFGQNPGTWGERDLVTGTGAYLFRIPFDPSTEGQRYQVAQNIFISAGVALEVAPKEVRELFAPASLMLGRDCRWCACLFDIALQDRRGISLHADRIYELIQGEERAFMSGTWKPPKCWTATIKSAVAGSIELIDMLVGDALTASETTTEPLANAEGHGISANGKATKRNPKRRGRKPFDAATVAKRNDLIQRWQQAKETGESQKEFCKVNGVTTTHLANCIEWAATRHRRAEIPTPTKPVKGK